MEAILSGTQHVNVFIFVCWQITHIFMPLLRYPNSDICFFPNCYLGMSSARIYKSHNALARVPQCTIFQQKFTHISVTKWCIVACGIGALWDTGLVHCGILNLVYQIMICIHTLTHQIHLKINVIVHKVIHFRNGHKYLLCYSSWCGIPRRFH